MKYFFVSFVFNLVEQKNFNDWTKNIVRVLIAQARLILLLPTAENVFEFCWFQTELKTYKLNDHCCCAD